MIPARYTRLGTVAAATIVFLILLSALRVTPTPAAPATPGITLEELQKVQDNDDPRALRPAVKGPFAASTTSLTTSNTPTPGEPTPAQQQADVIENVGYDHTAATLSTTTASPMHEAGHDTFDGIKSEVGGHTLDRVGTDIGDDVDIKATTTNAVEGEPTTTSSVDTQIEAIAALYKSAFDENVGPEQPAVIQPELPIPDLAIDAEPPTEADGVVAIQTAPSTPPPTTDDTPQGDEAPAAEISKQIVVGRTSEENTDWIMEELPDWQRAIYYVDLPSNVPSPSGLRTRMNKAREAMPYLTYIIDHYPDFPDVVAFIHPHKNNLPEAWHTDARQHNSVFMLRDLQLPTVLKRGYVNLRCNPEVGCPDEIQPFRQPPLQGKHAEHIFADVYGLFFHVNETVMRETIPVVATQCCAQFAVSGKQLRQRPRTDYELYRTFLEQTEYDDETVGRVMEYMWHMIFGREAVHCEDIFRCWCEVFDHCIELAQPSDFDFTEGWS